MRISNFLPHFGEKNLIVVAGKQEGCFYEAENSQINKIHQFKLSKALYTDREGRFEKRGHGRVFGSGSVYEPQDDQLINSFIKKLADETETLVAERGIKNIFLFCPTYLSNQIEEMMPQNVERKIEYIFYGNFTHQHPFVLLAMIQEYQKAHAEQMSVKPISGEALNILKNSKI